MTLEFTLPGRNGADFGTRWQPTIDFYDVRTLLDAKLQDSHAIARRCGVKPDAITTRLARRWRVAPWHEGRLLPKVLNYDLSAVVQMACHDCGCELCWLRLDWLRLRISEAKAQAAAVARQRKRTRR